MQRNTPLGTPLGTKPGRKPRRTKAPISTSPFLPYVFNSTVDVGKARSLINKACNDSVLWGLLEQQAKLSAQVRELEQKIADRLASYKRGAK